MVPEKKSPNNPKNQDNPVPDNHGLTVIHLLWLHFMYKPALTQKKRLSKPFFLN